MAYCKAQTKIVSNDILIDFIDKTHSMEEGTIHHTFIGQRIGSMYIHSYIGFIWFKNDDRRFAVINEIKDDFWCTQHIQNALKFANSDHTWEQNGKEFIHNTVRRDKIRNENFVETFPELASMING